MTYIKAKDWIQVSGTCVFPFQTTYSTDADHGSHRCSGDFTKLNIAPGDYGGQFDSKDKAPQGAKMHLDGDKEASSWVVSLPVHLAFVCGPR